MRRNDKSSLLFVLIFLLIVSVTFSIMSVEARKHHTKKSKPRPHKHQKDKHGPEPDSRFPLPAPAPLPHYGSYNRTKSSIFDVLSFGAKGDGVSDDTKALIAAWKAACRVAGATVEIPSEFKFLIKPITLQGPCMPNLVLQIDGTLLAPPKVGSWPKSSLFQWINFKWLHNFTIQGNGIVDGQGFEWWGGSQSNSIQKKSKHIPEMKPTALRFYASYNVTVRDIKINNSPLCHLKFDSSGGIKVKNIHISSPENSPNTDGIHLQNTKDVEIQHSDIACGDDCVSIQTGCSNVHIHHINCGPGHGISLGGLGKDKSVACVSDIVVEKISLQNTLAGVRIKTWQGGIGSVKNVSFSSIQVSDVKVPIIIDQYYCDKHLCNNQTGAVAISGVEFNQIIGTYSVQPIHLACSNSVPCSDVDLIDIQLKPSSKYQSFQQALCWNSYGKSQAPLVPSSIDYCLRRDSGSVKRIARSREHMC
ncbi:Pectin lyase-like superfamily protein [Citrus sinensis]|uniref:polygalacturonase At1g48100 n=1 Tax=Citrus sinensis TaxID=2711 RepID=UPI0003D6E80D|nr:polygalacturonase At1g48100 [Citrus sinensis]KAH9708779.1 Pectin lyase-like superfamily protein [Citrus sinensis]